MLKRLIYILLFLSILFPYNNEWATTRFEQWWNQNFNSMLYREPFSFIPYKIKLGKFYYGGNDFWSKVDLNKNFDLGESPFKTENSIDFNYIEDLKYREGLDFEIDFLGYNFLKNVQNSIDIISGFGYRFSRPLTKAPIDNWFDDNQRYYYYPVAGTFKFNLTFMVQRFENFSPYLNYSYGLTKISLFKNLDGDKIIKSSGIMNSIDIGFNIIKPLQNKNYNLLYGFELGFSDFEIDEITGSSSKLLEINTKDISFRFTIGIAYGGNKTVGDQGFNYLVNSDYLDAITSFNKFRSKYPKHPKINLANSMIAFSKAEIAYDMLYNGIESYDNNNIDEAIDWYRQALDSATDSSLIYEIQSRQYIIADYLYGMIDETIKQMSINESLDYIEYIENISPKISKNLKSRKIKLLYDKANVFIEAKNYISAFNVYADNKVLYPDDLYVYTGRINSLVKLLIDDTNRALFNQDYILAYSNMKLINIICFVNIDYLEDNISLLKDTLDKKYQYRIDENTQQLISNFKRQYNPVSQNIKLSIGYSFEDIRQILGSPIKTVDRINNNLYYVMAVYKIGNKKYRLFFEENILFDLEEVE
ncbi:MAG: hypothetical protein CMG66_05155 [Candidatus Marinimicrobia bacterium]|nr:hypothetical protein [Candidatus Neomarinimicrobiota bacterium]|tara:strand:- start:12327 stop:14093 length:1767 start_codon:yes stop_codon:yes gene_type:complete